MNKPAAIYARVSSDRQKENHTIVNGGGGVGHFGGARVGHGADARWR